MPIANICIFSLISFYYQYFAKYLIVNISLNILPPIFFQLFYLLLMK